MTTELKKFTEAYASMTVAVYEPLIVRWFSGWLVKTMADLLAWRFPKAKMVAMDNAKPTAHAIHLEKRGPILSPEVGGGKIVHTDKVIEGMDLAGRPFVKGEIRKVELKGFPEAVTVGDKVYPMGIDETHRAGETGTRPTPEVEGKVAMGAKAIPTFLNKSMGTVEADFKYRETRDLIFKGLSGAVENAIADPGTPVEVHFHKALANMAGTAIFEFFPFLHLEEALSPIGVAHYYRQLYFNGEEGVGPLEQAFTIAPLETLEVVYETTRRQVHEEIVEVGTETVSEKAVETKNLDEVSDKVSSMIQRDSSASMSANASGGIGVWQFGATASGSMSTASQRGREEASRRLKETTKRASERITKTFSIKTRDLEEVTTTNLTRRTIQNNAEHPVSYGLRRVFKRVHVKLQDLGPYLVWQLYVRNPGEGLARSRFVHFREAEPISVPEIPPGVRPRPKGGTDTGSTSSVVMWSSSHSCNFVTVVINAGSDRDITAVSIDSITDLEGGGKDDPAPSPLNSLQWGAGWDASSRTFTKNIAILPGDALSVSINYTYSWEPSKAILDEWELERQEAVRKLTEELLKAQFEREKALITEKSKIRQRPANDLRREERYEVINRMVSHLFAGGDDPSEPTPLEIEYFHRYFDIDGMFVYTHPSWWKPRFAAVSTGLGRPAYEITADSEPAPMGSSLRWVIQNDGDTRRNEFLNSPWVRVCLPMRATREREAIEWLAGHIEGKWGYDTGKAPLKTLLADIEKVRSSQKALGIDGPDWIKVDSTVGAPADPLKPEGVFPLVDEFEVTVPTDGFVYDQLKVVIP